MNLHHRNILFDLDGTLTDPREGITRSIQYALAKLGIDEPDLRALEHFIGPPLLQAFMQFYQMDEATAWQAVNFYRERFSVTGLYENEVFEGVIELLDLLVAQQRHLYIATSKPWTFAREIARHFDFARHFKVIYGSELDGTRTDKRELIAHLLHSEGLAPAHTLMIGDRKHDLLGARANGLDCVAVGYGFGSAEELREQAPTWHCATVAELHQALAGSPPR
ncbi:HAD hydrolase-like protein [Pseudomonas sp. NPDC007930]|uniref:HAD family hydrolase n=1 Tax=Pseudomonas sp. NPDC007930 TaxID=3364417 RepID=UPI0036EBCB2A